MSTEATQEVRIGATGPVSEEMPSLSDFAEETGGAWPVGWYAATVIEGYATRKGKQFVTEDSLSKQGDSHNARVCLKLDGGTLGTRQTFESFNYRTTDFSKERLAQIKELRAEFAGVKGAWPGQSDAQRTSLAIASLGQLEKALNRGPLPRTQNGNLNPVMLAGAKVDVRLNIDEKGYNSITAFAVAGSRAGK